MCYGCWEEAGKPAIDTPAVRAAAQAVADVYDHACTGGNLHIVLDDWNLEDGSLAFCDAQIARGGHPEDPNHSPWYTEYKLAHPDSPEQLAAERRCCDLFKALTEEERAAALALNNRFWGGCKECHGSGRTDNHVTGEVECGSCEGTGVELPADGDRQDG